MQISECDKVNVEELGFAASYIHETAHSQMACSELLI